MGEFFETGNFKTSNKTKIRSKWSLPSGRVGRFEIPRVETKKTQIPWYPGGLHCTSQDKKLKRQSRWTQKGQGCCGGGGAQNYSSILVAQSQVLTVSNSLRGGILSLWFRQPNFGIIYIFTSRRDPLLPFHISVLYSKIRIYLGMRSFCIVEPILSMPQVFEQSLLLLKIQNAMWMRLK